MAESSLERGIAVLRQFRRNRPVMSASELTTALGIPRSSMHRLLGELIELGLLRRAGDGRYALDSGVLMLGHEFLASDDVVMLGTPLLETLTVRTGWTSNLAVRNGTSIVYVARFQGSGAITDNVSIGTALPAHATLMGRLLLADLPQAELQGLYASYVFSDRGDAAPASLAALQTLLEKDRDKPCLVSDGYYETGLAVVAAPIRDHRGRIVAAINATRAGAHTQQAQPVAAAVIEIASAISGLLGGAPTPQMINGEPAWA